MGYLSNLEKPKCVLRWFIKRFRQKYNIDLSEYIVPEDGFKTFNLFFTRKLKTGQRTIEPGIISPVDGFIFDYGVVNPENKIHVKFKHYYIQNLIFEDITNLKSYAVLYLSPSNYHRVHASFDMSIDSIKYLPGTLRSVREKIVEKRNGVYCRNERIVIHGKSEFGEFYFIFVGAIFVGKVKLSFYSNFETNIKKAKQSQQLLDEPIFIKKGEELGYFEMGSSIILLMENDNLKNLNKNINTPIKVGQKITD
jgi:phosphatidylserine decarboxylase